MKGIELFDEVTGEAFSKFVDDYISKIEKWEWKHEGDFKVFLDELEEYLSVNERLDSEDFMYETEKNPFSSKDEYSKYMESFCNLIFSYCDKYSLPSINIDIEDNLCFNEYCLLLKYKENYYKVERISGQGTIDIISLYNGDNKKFTIDYDRLINGSCPENHEDIIEMVLDNALDSFKARFNEHLDLLGYDVAFIKKRK